MLTGIAHINLTVPNGTLNLAEEFYGKTLGMERVVVPALQKDTLAWSVFPRFYNSDDMHQFPE